MAIDEKKIIENLNQRFNLLFKDYSSGFFDVADISVSDCTFDPSTGYLEEIYIDFVVDYLETSDYDASGIRSMVLRVDNKLRYFFNNYVVHPKTYRFTNGKSSEFQFHNGGLQFHNIDIVFDEKHKFDGWISIEYYGIIYE
jgi:hypothetical protein